MVTDKFTNQEHFLKDEQSTFQNKSNVCHQMHL